MKSQFKSKTKFIFLISFLLILVLILLLLMFLNKNVSNQNSNKNPDIQSNISQDKTNVDSGIKQEEWNITIPKIFVDNAPIKEGIDDVTLDNYVGHFPDTSINEGNVGLAAHNRGYSKNYFSDINKLNIGDEIIYRNKGNIRKYKVSKKEEIDSYDWNYLNKTNDNVITLITCVDNKPDRRLVVQAHT